MAEKITFIHAADLHLGSPLKGAESKDPVLAEMLRESIWRSFDRLIEQALAQEVDFVLIAGDVFDSPVPSYAAMMRFIDGMERLGRAGVPVYICTGNHERAEVWESGLSGLPCNVTLFCKDEFEYALFVRDEAPVAAIVGRGFGEGSLADGLSQLSAEAVFGACGQRLPFTVGLLHTGLDVDRAIAPASPSQLRDCQLDYWALGHIHKRFTDDSDNPRIAYSGCIQGRDINEQGDRGCHLVCLQEGAPNSVRFLPLSSVVWERVPFDVSRAKDAADVERLLAFFLSRQAKSYKSDMLLARVFLEGATPAYDAFMRDDVLEGMRERINERAEGFHCLAIESGVRPAVDRDALYDQGLFPAALLSGVDALCDDPEELDGLLQDAFTEKKLGSPSFDDGEREDLCRQAEGMLLAMLMGGRHA